jgi:Gas vesicle protein G
VFLIDDLLSLPISGVKFVLRTLQQVAEEQYTDTAPGKRRLLELQVALESGEISEQEYVRQESEILQELREIENRKRRMAGAEPEEAPAVPPPQHAQHRRVLGTPVPQWEVESNLGDERSAQSGASAGAKANQKTRRAFTAHR